MVRTFLCHTFKEPSSFNDNYEPTALWCQRNFHMFIASSNGNIHIYNIDKVGCPKEHNFTSSGVVLKMEYCEKEKFLVTLEAKLVEYKKGITAKSVACQVRVYLNLHLSIPYRVYTTVANGYSNTLDSYDCKFTIIDLCLLNGVCDISLCKIKSNIAAASGSKVHIFAFLKKSFNTNNTVVDFYPLLEIECKFKIQSVSLYTNWLAFSCSNELRVIQIFLNNVDDGSIYLGEDVSELIDNTHEDQVNSRNQNDNYSSEDELIVWNFDQGADGARATSFSINKRVFLSKQNENYIWDSENSVINLDLIKDEQPYVDKDSSSKEVSGWIEELVGHPLRVIALSNEQPSCITRLYRRFEPSEISFDDMVDHLHSLQWLPVFTNESIDTPTNEMDMNQTNNCLKLPSGFSLLALAFFFSTGKHGFLYDFTNITKNIAVYSYASDCFSAEHTASCLNIVTKNGLEVYSSRLYALAADHYHSLNKTGKERNFSNLNKEQQEMKSSQNESRSLSNSDLKMNDEPISCQMPDIERSSYLFYDSKYLLSPCTWNDVDLCLVGFYSLSNIYLASSSVSKRVFLVKDQSKSKKVTCSISSWNVFVMAKASVSSIYENIMRFIKGSELTNPSVYYQLLSEAHLLVRSHLYCGINNDEKRNLLSLMKDSALKLADFFLCCDSTFGYYSQVSEFSNLAEVNFEQILKGLILEPKLSYGPGMIVYLNEMVFGDKKLYLEKEVITFVLDIYLNYKPSLLSKVFFDSQLQNIQSDLALDYLTKMKFKTDSRLRPYDYLCFAILNMELGDPAHAESWLKEMPEDSLITVCIKNYNLLSHDFTSPVGQLLQKRFKLVFTKILVSLFGAGKIDINTILKIFQKNKNGQMVCSFNVCSVLEGILNDGNYQNHFLDVAVLLIDQYLIKMSKSHYSEKWQTSHQHIPKGNGHFAVRFKWLDSMLPFTGDPPCSQDCIFKQMAIKNASKYENQVSSNLTNPNQYLQSLSFSIGKGINLEDSKNVNYCPCCCCCETLLKLQSILCSKYCKKQLATSVLQMLDKYSFVGKDTLLLLCWPKVDFIREAAVYLMANYVDITVQYANDVFDWKAQWQTLLQHVFELLKNDDMVWNKQAILGVLRGVLHRLTRAYSPLEFFDFLPRDGNLQFFLPFILECWFFTKANLLKREMKILEML